MKRLMLVLVALAVVASACGSTVQLRGARRGTGEQGLGADARPASGGDTGLGQAAGSAGGDTSAAAAATAARGASGRGATSSPGGAGANRAGTGTPGVTSKEVRIGITYVEGTDAVFAAVGASAISIGDTRAVFQQMVDHVNRTGGLVGRKVVPVYFAYKATGDPETQHQAACAAFTQDDHVLFATGLTLAFGPSGDTLVPCLAKAGAMWVGLPSGDDTFWSTYHRFLYSPDAINGTRELASLVDAVATQGFFSAGARIGLIQIDRPEISRAVERGLKPALARHGQKVAETILVPSDNSFPAAVSSTVLRFASTGVTHVMFAAPGGGGPDYFMTTANSQHYKPRYALSTWDAPSVVQALAPADQLKGTLGQGYSPVLDVDAGHDPGATAATRQCLDIYKGAGFDTSNRLTVGQMYLACDTFFFARLGFSRAPAYDAAGLERAVDALGGAFAPAGTFATRFHAGAHDGGGAYRYLVYGDDCSCFRYVGGLRDMP
jgi:ABC-type branched-subunit amino acid transport system substrate-binding protein